VEQFRYIADVHHSSHTESPMTARQSSSIVPLFRGSFQVPGAAAPLTKYSSAWMVCLDCLP
jgi:hypothetical protein